MFKKKTNSRILFLNFLCSNFFLSEENDINNIYFDCEFDVDLLNELINTYKNNKILIDEFISNNNPVYTLERAIITAGCTEIIMNNQIEIIIKEYLKISDNLSGMSPIIHKSIDKFYEQKCLKS